MVETIRTTGAEWFEKAQQYIPGGVNSPVRAFTGMDIPPPFIERAKGCYLYDTDGKQYIDYVGSYGPAILGHCDSKVVEAIQEQVTKGFGYGAPTTLEVEMAEYITKLVPSVEMLRMVSSGTEATMSAIRLARGYTGKNIIIKFAGNYHGHGDSFLIQAGSGALTQGVASSAGVPKEVAANTLVATYNDFSSVQRLFENYGEHIAAVILEPVVGNMGVVPGQKEFLQKVREITKEYGAVLIFDEVMTGFRVALGGAQSLYEITPDLTTFGKIIGGGMPAAAYGGKKEIMEMIAPLGPVYQAGTLSGNSVAMTAGMTTLQQLEAQPEIYTQLEEYGSRLEEGILALLQKYDIHGRVNRVGSMMTLFFTDQEVKDDITAKSSDKKIYKIFFQEMLSRGIHLPPSQYEAFFISKAHGETELNHTLESIEAAFQRIHNINT